MRVLAFDLGGTYGWAAAEDGVVVEWGQGNLGKGSRGERFYNFKLAVTGRIQEVKPDYVIYERPFARGRDATRCLWGYVAIVESVSHMMGLASIDELPSNIKKHATGKGTAKKPEMIAAAEIKAACVRLGEHEADAILLACYASEHVEVSDD